MIRKVVAIWVSLAMVFGFVVIVDTTLDIIPCAKGTTLYVNETGSGGAFASIQDAIDTTIPGDTVYVYSGTYFENLNVEKRIDLIGEDRNTTVINGGMIDEVIFLNANWVNITGFTITNSSMMIPGIRIENADNCRIANNNISFNRGGITIYSSSYITISDNDIISNGGYGIHTTSSNINIINNNISLNGYGGVALLRSSNSVLDNNILFSNNDYGIRFVESSHITMTNNQFIDDGISIEGIQISEINTHNIAPNNLVNGRPLNYIKDTNDIVVDGDFMDAGMIILANCNDVIIENHNITCTDVGIELAFSKNVTVIDNNISSTFEEGISLLNSSEIKVIENNISNNDAGALNLRYSTNNTIKRNNILNNLAGISLRYSSSNNIITNNDILSNTLNGIYVAVSSNNNKIIYNNISNNLWEGILITGMANNNYVVANDILSNIEEGISLNNVANNSIVANNISNNGEGVELISSVDNMIYFNNFIANIVQALDNTNDEGQWNNSYPSGGNYWDTYSGVDVNSGPNQDSPPSDGIGDSPYVIDTDSQDKYPLMEPYQLTRPSIPENPQLSSGDTFINLTWDQPASNGNLPITHFNIYRGLAPEEETFLMAVENVLYYNDTDVINGINYYYKISARDIISEGGLTDEVSAIPGAGPSSPIDLTTEAGDSYNNISWNPPHYDASLPILGYRIYRSMVSGEEGFFTEVGNKLFYNDTDVINGITYYYKIAALNIIGEGTQSIELIATPGTVPSYPTNLTALAGILYINLTWDLPLTDGGFPISNYIIYRGTASGFETFLIELGNVLYFNDTDITDGIIYYYRVSALNIMGESYISYRVNATSILDSDDDGIPDFEDTDDDNDGYSDIIEKELATNITDPYSFPSDFDKDFIPDLIDDDDDNDGYMDGNDSFPFNATEWIDTDGDDIGNNADPDDDGDGILDEEDLFPLDSTKWRRIKKEESNLFIPVFLIILAIVVIILIIFFIQRKKKSGRI